MSDLDPCPYCGRDDFGNAGARQNHVDACGDTETEQERSNGDVDDVGRKEEVEERLEEKALEIQDKEKLTPQDRSEAAELIKQLCTVSQQESRAVGRLSGANVGAVLSSLKHFPDLPWNVKMNILADAASFSEAAVEAWDAGQDVFGELAETQRKAEKLDELVQEGVVDPEVVESLEVESVVD